MIEWGKDWNRKTGREVTFDPTDKVLTPKGVRIGIPAVDDMLGDGFPKGRTTILFGEPGSGKTLLSQLVIAAAQREGGKCIFFDVERTYDPRWFALTGVDVSEENLIVVRPRNLEQTFDMVVDALETVKPDVIVVDSIPALVPKVMQEHNMEDKDNIGVSPRKIGEGIKLCTTANQSAVLIFINQLRTKIGVSFGNPETMPGGRQLVYASSLAIRVRRGAWLLSDEDKDIFGDDDDKEKPRVGFVMKLRTERNKIAPPFQDCSFEFRFNGTVDWISSLVHAALVKGIITSPSKGWFESELLEEKVHGRGNLEEIIRNNDELKNKLLERTK